MRSAALLVLAVLVLSGCAQKADPGADVGAATTNESAKPVAPNDDGSKAAMTVDTGHMPHLHDYWKGRERVTLFEGDLQPPQPDPFDSAKTIAVEKQAKYGAMPWTLPVGAIVYEGTGILEITATWTDPLTTSLMVNYKTPAQSTLEASAKLASGKASSIDVTPAMTDMPHSKTSRWQFEFEPAESPGVAMGKFHLKVEIQKLRDISLFPAHPELFHGAHEKIIEDADHSHAETSYAKRATQLATQGDFSEKEVMPRDIIPMETQWMKVEVDLVKADASPGQVVDINFFVHGADRATLGHPTFLPASGSFASKHLVYEFPVTMEQTDTPYGNQSQWRFFIEPATKFTGQKDEPQCGGCTDVAITYHLRVTVYDHPLEDTPSKKEGGG